MAWREQTWDEYCPKDEGWATQSRVRWDAKCMNRGKQWVAMGQHYKAAYQIIDKVRATGKVKMTSREAKRMKLAKCKDMAQAFLAIIKTGALFRAFTVAGWRIKGSIEKQKELQALYEEYLSDPEDPTKFARLEEMEELVAEVDSYQCADGDTSVLKALDFHYDMDDGFQQFDLCRRKVLVDTHCHNTANEHYWRTDEIKTNKFI